MKKISIITPSYNQSAFIEQTINSVLSQNYANLEYIIIDGGSTDGSVEIIKKYEKYLTHWVSEKDNGQSHAINKGFKMASGEIINWLNSDDYYEPDTFKIIAEQMKDEQVMVLSGRSKVLQANTIKYQTNGVDLYSDVVKTMAYARIDQPETFIRRKVLETTGLINEQLHYLMDREWWLRYLFYFGSKQVKSIDAVLVNFRLHEASKTVSATAGFEKESLSLYYSIAKKYGLEEAVFFEKMPDVILIPLTHYPLDFPEVTVRRIIHNYWLQQAEMAYAADDYGTAKLFLNQIKTDLLVAENKPIYTSLKNRITYLPLFLKKIWNKR